MYEQARNAALSMPGDADDLPDLLTPTEVARIFRVDPKTVTRWNRDGRLVAIRTLGGHRRFRWADVKALLEER